MTGQSFCYWHENMRRRSRRLDVPALEDPKAVQVAINRVIQALADGSMEYAAAGKILYGLQLALMNMQRIAEPGAKQPPPPAPVSDEYLDFIALVEPERLRRALATAKAEDAEEEAFEIELGSVGSSPAPTEAA